MAGIYLINYADFYNQYFTLENFINSVALLSLPLVNLKPYGPHISPFYLNEPLRLYKPYLDRNLIGIENKGRTIIYQWINLINGKMYVGSGWDGSKRLLSYWRPSVLKRNLYIYNSITFYNHNNFILLILEDLGPTGSVNKNYMLSREQLYLDLLFQKYTLLALNNSPTAGSTLGFKHKPQFIKNRLGNLNPMKGKIFSPEFIEMQKRNKTGKNNPLFGVVKSSNTLKKLIKLVYVYKAENMNYIGSYSTVQCLKEFKIGSDTLYKYLWVENNGKPYKGKIFSRIKLHNF